MSFNLKNSYCHVCLGLLVSSNPHVFITSCKTTLICINANLHGKLPPVALNVNALVFIVFFNTSLHAIPDLSICVVLYSSKQITKMYDMLNKNSLGLLKKGAAKQSRIIKGQLQCKIYVVYIK